MSGTVRRKECAGLGELGTRVGGLVGFGGMGGGLVGLGGMGGGWWTPERSGERK